jgi:branched-chain amino acid transport system permease protein
VKLAVLRIVEEHQGRRLFRFAPYLASIIFFILFPFLLSPFIQGLMARAFSFAIFAMSLDLLVGYTGLFSLGHAAFFGAGSYSVAMLFLHGGISSFWITAPMGIIGATILAAILGVIVVRFRGLYFMLLTFAFGELFFSAVWKIRWFQTPGIEACVGLPRPDLGIPNFVWTATNFYYFAFLFFIVCYFLLYRIINSPFGYVLKGIRENEPRMQALGYNSWLYKYISFVIAGFFAGMGGVLFAYEMRFTLPDLFGIQYSFLGQIMIILGGAGTLFGAAIGGLVIAFLEHITSLIVPMRWPLIMGILYVGTSMFFRGGLAPHLIKLWRRVYHSDGSLKT